MTKQQAEVIPFNDQDLKVYDEFEAQLTELEKWNNTAVFDYENEKGNKEARSHIYKLRKTKTAVDKARKDAGRDAMEYKRKVDAKGNQIIAKVEAMIEVHETPIKAIEQREKDRIAAHQEKIDELQTALDGDYSQMDSKELKINIDFLAGLEPDESFEEFTAPAIKLWKDIKAKLQTALNARLKYEAEQAELERLRAEKEERERKEWEEKIAKEAAEKARIEAESKAKAEAEAAESKAQEEREAAAKREAEAKAAQERAEQARIAAEEKAKQDAIEAEKRQKEAIKAAEERAKLEAEEAKQREIAEAKKREADKKHHARINNEALDSMVAACPSLDKVLAKEIVTAIAQGKIENVEIRY